MELLEELPLAYRVVTLTQPTNKNECVIKYTNDKGLSVHLNLEHVVSFFVMSLTFEKQVRSLLFQDPMLRRHQHG
jgi:hypothetical protein